MTVRSCIASSSADCVFGVARLISSANTRLAKIGPGLKAKVLMAVIVALHDHAADDIAGHQVGGELNPRIAEFENARKSAKESCFTEPGNTLEQNMTSRDETDQDAVDYFLLANDDLADFFAHTVQVLRRAID